MVYAIILLAGNSRRLKEKTQKQYFLLNNKELFLYPFETFYNNKKIDKIILVCDKKHVAFVQEKIKEFKSKNIVVIEGGETRRDSSFNALKFIKQNEKSIDNVDILIHDAARPLVNDIIINNCIKSLKKNEAITVALSSKDSLCKTKNYSKINSYLDRENVYQIQTPQGFKFNTIFDAHLKNKNKGVNDDAQLVKLLGKEIHLVEGSPLNFKITTNEDLDLLKKLIGG